MRFRDKDTLINRVYVPAVTVEYHYVCGCIYMFTMCVNITFGPATATATLNKLDNRSGITIRFFFLFIILLLC